MITSPPDLSSAVQLRSLWLFTDPHSISPERSDLMQELVNWSNLVVHPGQAFLIAPTAAVILSVTKWLRKVIKKEVALPLYYEEDTAYHPLFTFRNIDIKSTGEKALMFYNLAIIIIRCCLTDMKELLTSKEKMARAKNFFHLAKSFLEISNDYAARSRSLPTSEIKGLFPSDSSLNLLQYFCYGMGQVITFYMQERSSFDHYRQDIGYESHKKIYQNLARLCHDIVKTFSDKKYKCFERALTESKYIKDVPWGIGFSLIMYYASYIKTVFHALTEFYLAMAEFPIQGSVAFDRLMKFYFLKIFDTIESIPQISLEDQEIDLLMKDTLAHIQSAMEIIEAYPRKEVSTGEKVSTGLESLISNITLTPAIHICSIHEVPGYEKTGFYANAFNMIRNANECYKDHNKVYHSMPSPSPSYPLWYTNPTTANINEQDDANYQYNYYLVHGTTTYMNIGSTLVEDILGKFYIELPAKEKPIDIPTKNELTRLVLAPDSNNRKLAPILPTSTPRPTIPIPALDTLLSVPIVTTTIASNSRSTLRDALEKKITDSYESGELNDNDLTWLSELLYELGKNKREGVIQ